MSDGLSVDVNIEDIARDLAGVSAGIDRTIADSVHDAADLVTKLAHENMPLGTHDWAVSPGETPLPHIRDTYSSESTGLVATVGVSHPAGGVWESGGTIHPHSPHQAIRIPRIRPVGKAADETLDLFERHSLAAVNRLLSAFHL